ncbi:MAG: YihA family ribosome biogenesis GTP-binding protein [Ruminococcaceae bacterium]|nr:YihA family ribosome biogenesis GTP-binding protein [Oscillospiraceae bacterium]
MKLNLNNANLKISAGLPKQFPADRLPQVAFSGRSNVGKSSLINSLLNRKSLARVSGEPGKTITINFYDIDKKMYLVDLPGYGYAKRTFEDKQKWSALTDGFFTNNKNIDSVKLICQLIDSRTGPTNDDYDMLYYLREVGLPHIIVATKTDKLNATEKKKFAEIIAGDELTADLDVIMYSAKSNLGRDDLWKQLLKYCGL